MLGSMLLPNVSLLTHTGLFSLLNGFPRVIGQLTPLSNQHRANRGSTTSSLSLYEKLTVRNTTCAPTALLETLVADKQVATTLVSLLDEYYACTVVALQKYQAQLGSPPCHYQRSGLHSYEHIKGILLRGTMQPCVLPSIAI